MMPVDRSNSGSYARNLWLALSSRRTLAVTLLSFSSGLPLGLVWIAIPDWMRDSGFDIRVVGLTTLVHAPWTFKMVWSPFMDRYRLPWLGRRRGWIAIAQIALSLLTLSLAGVGHTPEGPWIILAISLAIAFASASQDIVIDAYAVDVLKREEHGVAVGARTAIYRAAMFAAGGLAITMASWLSWPLVNLILGLLYLPMLYITYRSPNSERPLHSPRSLREAVWHPFLGFLGRHRALEILAFVIFYKLADQLAQSLQRPFLIDMGYSAFDRGVALATVGLVLTIVGTFLGGALSTVIGLGHSLWIFGCLQIFSNVGYIMLARSEVDRLLMYGALSFETFTTGLGMGAFGVLLLRMTQKRFSATQYALFSSLFGLPRLIAGPVTGFSVHAASEWTGTLSGGWTVFFCFTMIAGIPGMLLLARFVPLGTRDPSFVVLEPKYRDPLSRASLLIRGVAGGLLAAAAALVVAAAVNALESAASGGGFDLFGPLLELLYPERIWQVLVLLGSLLFGAVCGLLTAAMFAVRHGAAIGLTGDEEH
jgi:PAT family beta-lactamase induction signal transducer AmpG